MRRGALRDQRGSLYVEFLIYMPLLLLLWWLMMYVHEVGRAGLQTSRAVRECAWFYATSGCKETPPQCQGVQLGGTREVDDADLHARSSSFKELGSDLPFLRDEMDLLHGDEFDVEHDSVVDKPPMTGGSRTLHRKFSAMCDVEVRTFKLDQVFDETCKKVLGRWCP